MIHVPQSVVAGAVAEPGSKTLRKTRIDIILVVLAFVLLALSAVSKTTVAGQAERLPVVLSSGEGAPRSQEQGSVVPEQHGLSQKAEEITHALGLPITNSMSWIVALTLILFAQIAARNMRQIPQGAQNFQEWVIEGVYKFLEGILGRHLTERTF